MQTVEINERRHIMEKSKCKDMNEWSDIISKQAQAFAPKEQKAAELMASVWIPGAAAEAAETEERCDSSISQGEQPGTDAGYEQQVGRDGLLTGLCLEAYRHGVLPYYLTKLVACAYLSADEENALISRLIRSRGIRAVVKEYSQITKEAQLVNLIAEQYERCLAGEELGEKEAGLIKKAYAEGFRYEQTYGGCGQCTLAAFHDTIGKQIDPAFFRACTTLAGGAAQCTDGSCGSYSGALLALGNYIGRSYQGMKDFSDGEINAKAHRIAQQLREKYINCYQSVLCKGVQQVVFDKVYLLSDEKELQVFPGGQGDKCPPVVGFANSWLVEILLHNGLIKA